MCPKVFLLFSCLFYCMFRFLLNSWSYFCFRYFLTSSSVFLFLWRKDTHFFLGDKLCMEPFQFPCLLGSHIPSSRVDLACTAFSCVQSVVWLPMLGIFFMCTQVLMFSAAYRGLTNTESQHQKLTGRKMPCHSRVSNLSEQCVSPCTQPTKLHLTPVCFFASSCLETNACGEMFNDILYFWRSLYYVFAVSELNQPRGSWQRFHLMTTRVNHQQQWRTIQRLCTVRWQPTIWCYCSACCPKGQTLTCFTMMTTTSVPSPSCTLLVERDALNVSSKLPVWWYLTLFLPKDKYC